MQGMKLGGRDNGESPRGQALTPSEIKALLNASKENAEGKPEPLLNDEAKLMVWTAILTGMRRGEQFGLQWEDVDFENNVIHIKQSLYWNFGKEQQRNAQGRKYILTTPKSKYAIRTIDLSLELKKMLRVHYIKSDQQSFVFKSPKKTPICPENFVARTFKPAARAIGLPDLRWHDLRHTFGSLLIDQGEDLVYVSRQLGHSNVSVTSNIYAHLIRKHRPEAVAKLDKLLFGSAK